MMLLNLLLAATAAAGTYRSVDLGKTPFPMEPIPEYVFPEREFRVTDYGALADEHYRFFRDADRDRLHPNDYGHRRIAEAMRAAVLALPAEFKIREGVGD